MHAAEGLILLTEVSFVFGLQMEDRLLSLNHLPNKIIPHPQNNFRSERVESAQPYYNLGISFEGAGTFKMKD